MSYPAQASHKSEAVIHHPREPSNFFPTTLALFVGSATPPSRPVSLSTLDVRCSPPHPLHPPPSSYTALQRSMARRQFTSAERLMASAGFDAHARPRAMGARTIGPHNDNGTAGSGITDVVECIADGAADDEHRQ